MNSIRLRTAALVAVCIMALLVLGGVALMVVIRAALTAQFDDALAARAGALQSLARFDGTKVEMDFAGEAMPRFAHTVGRSGDAEYFVAWVREGSGWRVLERSESLKSDAWPPATLRDGPASVRDITLPSGHAGRAAFIEFSAPREHDEEGERGGDKAAAAPAAGVAPASAVRLLVALPRAPLDRTLAAVGWSIFGVGITLALSSVLLVRWAVGRGLMPLSHLSGRISTLRPETLGARFDSADLPLELRPIAEQLSALLARLDEAFERERRFSAAASHELRTPIAELRMLLEVARSRPRSGEEWLETNRRALGVLDRAQALCEMLLRLARAEAAPSRGNAEDRADVAALIAEHVSRSVARHGGDAVRVRVRCEPDLAARIEPAALGVILSNLLDNALTHGAATAADPILIGVSSNQYHVVIGISNTAPGITPEDASHLFEPFWRKDPSRHDQSGFGLGLAVARTLARAMGGNLTASLSTKGTLSVTLTVQAASENGAVTP